MNIVRILLYSFSYVLLLEELNRNIPLISIFWGIVHFKFFILQVLIVFSIFLFGKIFADWINYKIYVFLISFFGIVLTFLNKSKINHRGEGLYVTDIVLWQETYKVIMENTIYKVSLFFIVSIVMVSLCFLFKRKSGRTIEDINEDTTKVKLFSLIFVCLVSVLLLTMKGSAYFEVLYKHSLERQEVHGFVNHFYIESKVYKKEIPEQYSKDSINHILQSYQHPMMDKVTSKEKPNILFVLNESFLLQENLGIEAKKDATPFMRNFITENISGYHIVEAFGGGTAEVEFEVLSGLAQRMQHTNYKSASLYINFIKEKTPTIAHSFKNQGYRTIGLHTYDSSFYKRKDVYPLIGFDEFRGIDELHTKVVLNGEKTSDETLYNEILYELKKNEKPVFISGITYQGHGFYSNLEFEDHQVSNDLPDEEKKELNQYFTVLNKVDQNIKEFIGQLENLDEPTIVLFYSDHFPSFETVDYDKLLPESERYAVPYVLWANYELNIDTGKVIRKDLQSFELTSYLMDLLNINTGNIIFEMHNLYRETKDEEMKKDFELLMYDMIFGEKYYKELLELE